MPLELTPAQARALGINVKGAKVSRKPKDRSVAEGPYRWRCACGETGDSHASADRHVAPGHNRFETIMEGQ